MSGDLASRLPDDTLDQEPDQDHPVGRCQEGGYRQDRHTRQVGSRYSNALGPLRTLRTEEANDGDGHGPDGKSLKACRAAVPRLFTVRLYRDADGLRPAPLSGASGTHSRTLPELRSGLAGPANQISDSEALMNETNLHCQNFQKHLSRLKVDGYWVTHIPDLFYLSGYGAEGCWGLFGKKRAAMLVPMLAADQAVVIAKGFEIIQLKKFSEAYARVVEYAVKAGWKTIGYDPYHTTEAYILGL